MFDITSSKLLILGIVALLVIGPKDLPALLRTIGKYVGIIKRHAADFRAQFEDAIRETEIEQLKKDVEQIGAETQSSFAAAEQSVNKELSEARSEVDAAMDTAAKPAADPVAHDADALPVASTGGDAATAAPLNGAGHEPEPAVATDHTSEPAETQKSGA